ncbi:hypothetical protein [Slackia equolifaciens]|uniref:hypothetical protein n=1 Tax=Slackia equolifaciens TaxID=498718 RepID=UPI00137AD6CA|nr:hypothetical protein [Slackia equolifaciens]
MDGKRYVSRLLEDLAHIASGEERDAFDPDWLRGYVAVMSCAAQYALELDEKENE